MVDKKIFGAIFFLIAIGCTYATIGEGIEGAGIIAGFSFLASALLIIESSK